LREIFIGSDRASAQAAHDQVPHLAGGTAHFPGIEAVDIEVQLKAEPQEDLPFQDSGGDLRMTDGPQEDGIQAARTGTSSGQNRDV